MKVIHIGFGKTATSTLQLVLFPEIANLFSKEYINGGDARIRCHVARMALDKKANLKNLMPDQFLVSSEDLCSWDPFFWEVWADMNLGFFGSDSHILLTIREPKSYLTAVYLQTCLHEGNVQPANDFFLGNEEYSPYLATAKFAIDEFSYTRIIDLYRTRFNKVTVVKYESLQSMEFLKDVFGLEDVELAKYQEAFSAKRVNQSYSKRSVRLTFAFQRSLERIGLSIMPMVFYGATLDLKSLRSENKVVTKSSENRNPISNFLNKVLQNMKWRSLMHRMDIYFPSPKYQLEFEALPQINLEKLVSEYDSLPDLSTK